MDDFVIDVGAFDGKTTLALAKRFPDCRVLAIEPVPEHYDKVVEVTAGISHIEVLNLAVDTTSGDQVFYVDRGCSSLLEYADDLDDTWRKRVSHTNFVPKKTITVKTEPLSKILEAYPIRSIAHLHIDAQGKDLSVLQSLGAYQSFVRGGLVEAQRIPIYKDQPLVAEVELWLAQNGFEVTRKKENNAKTGDWEFNIAFRQNGAIQ